MEDKKPLKEAKTLFNNLKINSSSAYFQRKE